VVRNYALPSRNPLPRWFRETGGQRMAPGLSFLGDVKTPLSDRLTLAQRRGAQEIPR